MKGKYANVQFIWPHVHVHVCAYTCTWHCTCTLRYNTYYLEMGENISAHACLQIKVTFQRIPSHERLTDVWGALVYLSFWMASVFLSLSSQVSLSSAISRSASLSFSTAVICSSVASGRDPPPLPPPSFDVPRPERIVDTNTETWMGQRICGALIVQLGCYQYRYGLWCTSTVQLLFTVTQTWWMNVKASTCIRLSVN